MTLSSGSVVPSCIEIGYSWQIYPSGLMQKGLYFFSSSSPIKVGGALKDLFS